MHVRVSIVVAALMGLVMSSSTAATYVYVGNADSQDISVLELRPDGDLKPLQTVAVPGPAKPGSSMPLVVSPEKHRLYAGLRNEPYSAVTFDIDARTGRLKLVGPGPLPESMAYLAIDRTGRFLLSASYGGNQVAVSPITPNGTLAPAVQIVPTAPNAHCIIVDPTNSYVLHTSLGGDVIYQDKFDATSGKLTPNTPPSVSVPAKSGPRHLVFAPDGKMVYLLDELDAAIHVFPWNAATGTLGAEVQVASALPKSFDGKPWAADIHLTPDGRYLYASERTSSTLSAFRVDAETGKLAALGAYATEKQPRSFAIDPSGHFLLAVGQASGSMTSYAIDRNSGALARLAEAPMGKNPNWVEIVRLP